MTVVVKCVSNILEVVRRSSSYHCCSSISCGGIRSCGNDSRGRRSGWINCSNRMQCLYSETTCTTMLAYWLRINTSFEVFQEEIH